ncbi:UNVERIFIED_ORG: hypothetical protein FHR35_001457 [Microbispora rosea subsp. rosea]
MDGDSGHGPPAGVRAGPDADRDVHGHQRARRRHQKRADHRHGDRGRLDRRRLGHRGAEPLRLDGVRVAGGQATGDGITGCASRPLRFAADQGGGQRLSGAVDRMAIFARRLSPEQVKTWQDLAF